MSSAYESVVIEKNGDTAVIEVRQHHPDYLMDDDEFPEVWGAWAIAGWAFHDSYAYGPPNAKGKRKRVVEEGETTALGREIGGSGNLFDEGFGLVEDCLEVVSFELVRSGYNDDNRDERLAEAGYSEEEIEDISLTGDVVSKICGIARITVRATQPGILDPLPVGATWEY